MSRKATFYLINFYLNLSIHDVLLEYLHDLVSRVQGKVQARVAYVRDRILQAKSSW